MANGLGTLVAKEFIPNNLHNYKPLLVYKCSNIQMETSRYSILLEVLI
jgi:hypothetical protein